MKECGKTIYLVPHFPMHRTIALSCTECECVSTCVFLSYYFVKNSQVINIYLHVDYKKSASGTINTVQGSHNTNLCFRQVELVSVACWSSSSSA